MKPLKVYELDCREKCDKVGMKMSSLLSNHRSEGKAMQCNFQSSALYIL